jgi:hypothetical protein
LEQAIGPLPMDVELAGQAKFLAQFSDRDDRTNVATQVSRSLQ